MVVVDAHNVVPMTRPKAFEAPVRKAVIHVVAFVIGTVVSRLRGRRGLRAVGYALGLEIPGGAAAARRDVGHEVEGLPRE